MFSSELVTKSLKTCIKLFKCDNINKWDYVYLILSSLIASSGFILDSETVIIGSMLISPLLKPIMLITFDIIKYGVKKYDKLYINLYNLLLMIIIVITIGYICSVIALHVSLKESNILKNETMKNRSFLFTINNDKKTKIIWICIIAACCGVVIGISSIHNLGKYSTVIVGAGISSSVLPPLIAAGMYFSIKEYNRGLSSLVLSLINIIVLFIFYGITKIILCS